MARSGRHGWVTRCFRYDQDENDLQSDKQSQGLLRVDVDEERLL
jgi:hypothetical protein